MSELIKNKKMTMNPSIDEVREFIRQRINNARNIVFNMLSRDKPGMTRLWCK